MVYVSSSGGNDANSGLSEATPVKSLAAGYALIRDGFPDWLLLKRGDRWSGSFPDWVKGGRDAVEVMIVGSYGEGPRPRIESGSGAGFFSSASNIHPLAHFAMLDLHFVSDRVGGTSSDAGVTFLNAWTNVLIENCRIEGYRDNLVFELLETRPRSFRVRRCVILDSSPRRGSPKASTRAAWMDW